LVAITYVCHLLERMQKCLFRCHHCWDTWGQSRGHSQIWRQFYFLQYGRYMGINRRRIRCWFRIYKLLCSPMCSFRVMGKKGQFLAVLWT